MHSLGSEGFKSQEELEAGLRSSIASLETPDKENLETITKLVMDIADAPNPPSENTLRSLAELKNRVTPIAVNESSSLNYLAHTVLSAVISLQTQDTSPMLSDKEVILSFIKKERISDALDCLSKSAALNESDKREINTSLETLLKRDLNILQEAPPEAQADLFSAIVDSYKQMDTLHECVLALPEDIKKNLKAQLDAERKTLKESKTTDVTLNHYCKLLLNTTPKTEQKAEEPPPSSTPFSFSSLFSNFFSFSFLKAKTPPKAPPLPVTENPLLPSSPSAVTTDPESLSGSSDKPRANTPEPLVSAPDASSAGTNPEASSTTSESPRPSSSIPLESQEAQDAFAKKDPKIQDLRERFLNPNGTNFLNLFSSMIGGQEIQGVEHVSIDNKLYYKVILPKSNTLKLSDTAIQAVVKSLDLSSGPTRLLSLKGKERELFVPKELIFSLDIEAASGGEEDQDNKGLLSFLNPENTIIIRKKDKKKEDESLCGIHTIEFTSYYEETSQTTTYMGLKRAKIDPNDTRWRKPSKKPANLSLLQNLSRKIVHNFNRIKN